MKSKFGFLSKLNFLQDFASYLISLLNCSIIHNLEKYYIIKKVHYLSSIENLEGDYLEFGIFTGSSFCHSLRCVKSLSKFNENILKTKFYGFDLFSGFGKISEDDRHPFYTDINFSTDLKKVEKRIMKVAEEIDYKLIPGFFSETLKIGPKNMGIVKSRIIFIDCDTYTSANEALTFCIPTIQNGTYIILDDYYSYKGSNTKGVRKAFSEFLINSNIEVRHVFNYGMGGAVYIVSNK